jgi:desulfoferrodoxin-like iron-binding protein
LVNYPQNSKVILTSKQKRRSNMAEKGEVYQCEICGNVVSVLQGGDGDLVCCGEEMVLLSDEEARKYK